MSLLVGEHPEGAVQDDRGSQEPDQARQEGKTKNRLQKCFFVLALAGSFLLSCLLHLSSLTKFRSFSSFLFIFILVFYLTLLSFPVSISILPLYLCPSAWFSWSCYCRVTSRYGTVTCSWTCRATTGTPCPGRWPALASISTGESSTSFYSVLCYVVVVYHVTIVAMDMGCRRNFGLQTDVIQCLCLVLGA